MAHPIFALVDQAMRNYFDQWFNGLQPTLTFESNSNGVVNVFNRISCQLPPPMVQHEPYLSKQNWGAKTSHLSRKVLRRNVRPIPQRNVCQPPKPFIESHTEKTRNT